MAALYEVLCHADDADLFYVVDDRPGITRRRRGRGFSYHHPDGTAVDAEDKARIGELVIPPAWTDVWICPLPDGHIQATGRDAKGRKQYRYHDRWREVRDADKYERLADFAAGLPDLRATVDDHLGRRGLPQEKVLAAVVRLLDETLIRIGNDEYAETNESFGLTTIECDHVDVEGTTITFEFRGKSGVEQAVSLRDRRLASIVQACQDLPGEDLFGYLDADGKAVDVTSTMVNDYLRATTGSDVTAKHFRTWGGTVTAAELLAPLPVPETETEAKSNELAALDMAADRLGNTRTVCRNCYVHPHVGTAYREGDLQEAWKRARSSARFSRTERAVLTVLEQRT
ncbi:MAG: putative topoisomerase [Actinomycetia bacterium]|nr:putative topoisomerase [Actinomycetes bacterium]